MRLVTKQTQAPTRVSVLGAGSWGTTIASLMARNADVCLWARDPAVEREVNDAHTNQRYLPDASLSPRLRATSDLVEAVVRGDVLVMAIPSQNYREVLMKAAPHLLPGVPIVSLTKGLELSTRLRMTEVTTQVCPDHVTGALTGPNLAREVIAGYAAACVLAMPDEASAKRLQPLFHTRVFRVYRNNDVIGSELGGVLKNVIAVAAGMGDGQGAGENTRSALITRGLAEITRLGVALGGRTETFSGLAGMGDLVATCTSPQSRNHHVGVELGKGRSIDDITAEMFMVAEGVKSAPAVVALAREHNVEMPLVEGVFNVVQGKLTASQAVREIMRADIGSEAEPN